MFRPLLVLFLLAGATLAADLPVDATARRSPAAVEHPIAPPVSSSADIRIPATIRVRLLEQLTPRTVTIGAPEGGLLVFTGSGSSADLTITAGGRATVTLAGRDVRIVSGSRTLQTSLARFAAPSGDAITLQTGSATRSYRGEIRAEADGSSGVLRLINHVPVEEYVASVVASEYGLDDLEGSKAMAVIARTYALKALKSADYDQVDHTLSQVYKGTRAVTPRALEAARLTAGEVLTYEGDLIVATYYSSSGGHTANNEDVWQANALPYLRARTDPWDTISPHREWRYEVTSDALHGLLRESFGLEARSIEIEDRSADGRVRTLRIGTANGRDRSLSSQEFRLQVIRSFGPTALRSTMFSLESSQGKYTFVGRGFGHGVGLSQWGAHAMALDGRSYQDILGFYYRDVELERTTSEVPSASFEVARSNRAPEPAMTVASAPPNDAATDVRNPEPSEASRTTASRVSDALNRAAGRPAGWSAPSSNGRVISRRVSW